MPWEEERNSATSACTKKQIRSQQRTWDSRSSCPSPTSVRRWLSPLGTSGQPGSNGSNAILKLAIERRIGSHRYRASRKNVLFGRNRVWVGRPWRLPAPRRGGEPRLELAPAPRKHAGCPIPIPGGHPGCRGCRPDVGCTDVSAKRIDRDVDCSRGAETCSP